MCGETSPGPRPFSALSRRFVSLEDFAGRLFSIENAVFRFTRAGGCLDRRCSMALTDIVWFARGIRRIVCRLAGPAAFRTASSEALSILRARFAGTSPSVLLTGGVFPAEPRACVLYRSAPNRCIAELHVGVTLLTRFSNNLSDKR